MPSRTPRARPRFRPVVWCLTAVVALAGCGAPAETPPRHLILVVFDTLRADRMSVYGYERPTTPFLEAVAGQFVRFAEVKAPASWTLPSHASLFTARWPVDHGVHWGNKWLDERFETLAEVLQGEGFCTFGLSANPIVSDKTGLDQGFDSYRRIPRPAATQTQRLLERVPELLDRAAAVDCRLFLFLNLMDTHTPFSSDEFGSEFGVEGPDPVPDARSKWEIAAGRRPFPAAQRQRHQAAYDAAVRGVDETARRLVELLRQRALLDESLLVLTSDHGEGLGAHSELGHVISVWEEQLAVPLLVRFPHGRRGGTVVEDATSSVYLAPSTLDWLEVARPAAMAGVPRLDDGAAVVADYRSYFDPAFTANQPMRQAYPDLVGRTPHTHVTYCPPFKLMVRADRTMGLFDLATDPGEITDLADLRPEALRHCVARYRELSGQGVFMPFDLDLESASLEQVDDETLRSLGYLQ